MIITRFSTQDLGNLFFYESKGQFDESFADGELSIAQGLSHKVPRYFFEIIGRSSVLNKPRRATFVS